MKKLLLILRNTSNTVDNIAKGLSIFYVFLSTIIVLSSVFLRMAGAAPSWTEELARWLLVCITFVAGSVALKRGQHIGVTALVKVLKNKRIIKIILQVSNLLVSLFLVYAFYYNLDAAFKSSDQVGDMIPVSVVYVKLHLPLGILFMLTHLAYYIVGATISDDPYEFMLSQ